ncbi:hypothetical protein I302_107398 [Kwoniella bestiolae CBS 10118]|uniref:Uncharacterized protein n=1 Tax=Kwoniella bestiolae CBS 10118 TaxID=1296100 RepID=A0A1B9FYM7_9TREE|nr:hypothetical protein I302_06864 [Kwoniella bestiolae CBS 10118]OCF23878.1 hypothetical protein I302_06864 [Kwoniella bestiolae CBS 10118]
MSISTKQPSPHSPPGPLPSPPLLGTPNINTSNNDPSSSSVVRRPTLHFPTLHLGSFDTLSTTQSLSPVGSNSPSPSRRDFGNIVTGGEPRPSGSSQNQARAEGNISLSVEPTRSSSHSSRSSSHRLHKGPIPPPLPPPTMALPPLPTLSPISPIGPPLSSPSYTSRGIQSNMFQPRSSSSSSSSLAQQQQAGEGRRELPTVPTRNRSMGHSLTIHVPGPLTPSPSDQEGNPLPSPILKHSPGVARRRTVIENSNTNLGSPVRVSGFTGSMTPPGDRDSSPTRDNKSPPIERGSILMPQPRPSPAVEQAPTMETPRRLEKKRSSADLKSVSPTSPTAKRSLPRPPKIDTSLDTKSSNPDLPQTVVPSSQMQTAVPTDLATAPHPRPQQDVAQANGQPQKPNLTLPLTAPVPSSSWPPLNIARSPTSSKPPPTRNEPAPKPNFYQKHQANKSASSLPVVAGLADAGPFAGAFTKPVQASPVGVGLGRPSNQATNGQGRGPSVKPQEEICLECMMRDRDLADVTVQGEGVWERESDADWRDLEWKEQALLKHMGNIDENPSLYDELTKAADESSEDTDSTSFSPPSTGNSAEDANLRRELDARRRRRSLIKAKKREADWRIATEVGWRGHKWEGGETGEGLPRGFRGTNGGKLTEEGIKAVMTKFPSASAHRYQTLQTYLRQQWHLVLEVRAQAQRLGRFPFPEDIVGSSSTVSSHEAPVIPRGAQPSSMAWDRHGRDINDQMRGVHTPVQDTPSLSVVRPSPSSPANLTGLANPPRPAPIQRPLTHFLPDREPSLGAPRTPLYASPVSATTRSRHGKQGSSPGLLERQGTYEESNEELWSPGEEGCAGLRPFSFAVRAGAAAGRDAGSDGHGGRRSLWGRFGGSVTSFFGGSQNGSGSMMDMHLGLDNERRNRTSSYNVTTHPRAVSMASPTRPSFFSRDSRCSSDVEVNMPRMSRAISHSRLSQMRLDDDGDEDHEEEKPKKKGIKGFFKKMKPKSSRSKSKSDLLARPEDEYGNDQPQPDTPLAPPPPLSYLVGNRKHTRDRSGSSSSMLTDGQESNQGRRYSGSLPYAMRSVSAPMNGTASSSGGSLSASPTSSKFATSGPGKRESYASNRRRSFGVNELGEPIQPEQMGDRRQSGMETLSGNGNGTITANGRGVYSSPDTSTIYDEPSSMYKNNTGLNFRPHNKTTSSLSNSSGTMAIETPPPAIYNPSSFFNQQQQHQIANISHGPMGDIKPVVRSPSGQLSPNRFKNLPPLPPGQEQGNGMGMTSSPDSFAAAFPDQEINLVGTIHDPKYLNSYPQKGMVDFSSPNTPTALVGSPNSIRYQRGQYNGYPQPHQLQVNTQQYPSAHARAMATGRASFDQPSPRARVGSGNERNVKTMYGQLAMDEGMGQGGYPKERDETKRKKGFKGFFGGSKAGRMV